MINKTDLNFDFMAHEERCQEEIYEAIHTLSYQEQIRYYSVSRKDEVHDPGINASNSKGLM